MKIGLIGTGRMGTALGGRLLDGGHSLRVFDLDPASVAPLVARGATHAAALEDTFDTDLVITLVPDDKAVEAMGCHGEWVEKPGEIRPALQRALSAGKPAVVNIKIGTSEFRKDAISV